jgi:hypothetical protein
MMHCSKVTSSANVCEVKTLVCESLELIEGCNKFLEEYKGSGIYRATSAAALFANHLEVEPEFQNVKRI